MSRLCVILILVSLPTLLIPVARAQAPAPAAPRTIDVPFTSHDGLAGFATVGCLAPGGPVAVARLVS